LWLHGEAVAAGMVVALELSARLGWIDESEVDRLKKFLMFFELPTFIPKNISIDEMLANMSVDKKVINGKLRLVLIKKVGEAIVTDTVPLEDVKAAMYACYE
jgi:3-dehydroquinate synthase